MNACKGREGCGLHPYLSLTNVIWNRATLPLGRVSARGNSIPKHVAKVCPISISLSRTHVMQKCQTFLSFSLSRSHLVCRRRHRRCHQLPSRVSGTASSWTTTSISSACSGSRTAPSSSSAPPSGLRPTTGWPHFWVGDVISSCRY